MYESECDRCVTEVGSSDNNLEKMGANASLYVGESARSLFERSGEHWQAAQQKKEESHMHQHMVEMHGDVVDKPEFKFKVVKAFKSALDRQVAEAIRIEMRGNVLNRRGEFNRCSLTRLGVDYKWEDERWKRALERVEGRVDEIEYLEESEKTRRGGELLPVSGAKKRKLEIEGVVWGESVTVDQQLKIDFLKSEGGENKVKSTQSKLKVLTGIEWIVHQLVQDMTGNAVDRAWDMDSVARWEEWDDEPVQGVDKVLLDPPTTKKRVEGGPKLPTLKPKRGRKSKMGVSSSQKSVVEFFNVCQVLGLKIRWVQK